MQLAGLNVVTVSGGRFRTDGGGMFGVVPRVMWRRVFEPDDQNQIAQATNGQYFAAATVDQLKTVYANIGSEVGYEKAEREVTSRFAGYGLAFAVLAALGAISLGAKWP